MGQLTPNQLFSQESKARHPGAVAEALLAHASIEADAKDLAERSLLALFGPAVDVRIAQAAARTVPEQVTQNIANQIYEQSKPYQPEVPLAQDYPQPDFLSSARQVVNEALDSQDEGPYGA
jgi:hypothetical protein